MIPESYLIMATLSLVIELTVIGLLIFGYMFKRGKNYRRHGIIMTTAVVLHLITIFSWMLIQFISFFTTFAVNFTDPIILVALIHAPLGAIAASLGIYLVGAWHLQLDVQGCFGRKRIMLTTITIWSTAIALGIILYLAVILSA